MRFSSTTLAVDIDDTIAQTGLTWARILQSKFPLPLPADQLFEVYGAVEKVPPWRENKEAMTLISLWRESPEAHQPDPVPDAAAVLQGFVERTKIHIAYVSMRSEPLREGTVSWLQKHHFPEGEVILCPPNIAYEDRPHWKAKIMMQHKELIALIDDRVDVAMSLPEDFDRTMLLLWKKVSPRDDISVIPVKDWLGIQDELHKLLRC